jgi:hypothetical protein
MMELKLNITWSEPIAIVLGLTTDSFQKAERLSKHVYMKSRITEANSKEIKKNFNSIMNKVN